MMYTHLFKSLPATSAAFASVLAGVAAVNQSEDGWKKKMMTTQCHHKTKDVVGMLHDLDERVSFLLSCCW